MTHDPMCPFQDFDDVRFLRDDGRAHCFGCEHVAMVRNDVLDKVIEAIEALPPDGPYISSETWETAIHEAIVAINALRGES